MVLHLLILSLLLPAFSTARAAEIPKDFPEKLSIELNEVNDGATTAISSKLDEIEKSGTTKEVWLRINSYGGDVDAGQTLISRLEQSTIPVTCVADFKAMSMAAFIFESPGCKTRLMTDRTVLMFHKASVSGARGNEDTLQMFVNWLHRLDRSMARDAAKRMGLSVEDFEKHYDRTPWFLDVDEAKAAQAFDAVTDPLQIPKPVQLDQPANPLWFL